jgi:hypothetical protein
MLPTPLSRIAGPLAILAGALLLVTRLVTLVTMPGDAAQLRAAVMTPLYAVNSVGAIFAFAVLVLALIAIHERQAHAAGWLGVIGVGAAIIGTVFMAGDWWFEAFAVPWMADVAGQALDAGVGGRLLIGGLASFALFAVGWIMFGIASLRASIYPMSISVGLVIGGLLSGIAISGAYLVGGAMLGLVVMWLGYWVTRTPVHQPSRGPAPLEAEALAIPRAGS